MDNNILFAFLLTLFAGLSTGIGSLIAFLAKDMNKKFLSISLGFSAGVMIYVSMVEIFVKAKDSLILATDAKTGYWLTTIAFFAGILFIAIIDKIIPKSHNPHEIQQYDENSKNIKEVDSKRKLLQMGMFTALAVGIHNLPEGLATFISALESPSIAIPIAVAIAIHNIPEGIAVSVPIYYATGSKRKAFVYSFLSGLAEPVGAIVGFTILRPFISDLTFGLVFAGVAGIMVFISVDELLPTAEAYGEHHLAIYGLIAGMAIMALSLLLFI